ncbi:MAG: hypothetical protein WA154_12830 [Moraxellaceae bacterium]
MAAHKANVEEAMRKATKDMTPAREDYAVTRSRLSRNLAVLKAEVDILKPCYAAKRKAAMEAYVEERSPYRISQVKLPQAALAGRTYQDDASTGWRVEKPTVEWDDYTRYDPEGGDENRAYFRPIINTCEGHLIAEVDSLKGRVSRWDKWKSWLVAAEFTPRRSYANMHPLPFSTKAAAMAWLKVHLGEAKEPVVYLDAKGNVIKGADSNG